MDRRLLPLALVLALAACAATTVVDTPANATPNGDDVAPQGSTNVEEPPVRWECDEPRPTRCSTQTAPVCGSNSATYRNDCYACRDIAVAWYAEGTCV